MSETRQVWPPLTGEEQTVLDFIAEEFMTKNHCPTGPEIVEGTELSAELVALAIACLFGRGYITKVSQELAQWVTGTVKLPGRAT
jgi:hypothetical protein